MNYLKKTIIAVFISSLFLATSCNLHDNKVTPAEKNVEKELSDQKEESR